MEKISYLKSYYQSRYNPEWEVTSMGNPNPSPKTRFATKRLEPLTEKLTLRLTASMYAKLLEQKDYREFIREAIAEKLARS